jgi:hypothetical protein
LRFLESIAGRIAKEFRASVAREMTPPLVFSLRTQMGIFSTPGMTREAIELH